LDKSFLAGRVKKYSIALRSTSMNDVYSIVDINVYSIVDVNVNSAVNVYFDNPVKFCSIQTYLKKLTMLDLHHSQF
jgi:hypothetical protein